MSDTDPRERFAELRKIAKAQGSDLDLHITVGGVRITELYRVKPFANQADTLDGQLDQMETMLGDPRHAAAARATRLMQETEGLGTAIAKLIEDRRAEYEVAIRAFRSITTDPPVSDDQQAYLAGAVTIAKVPAMFEVLLDIADESLKKKAEASKATEAPPEEPADE